MSTIQNLQSAYSRFRTEVPVNPSCWREKGKLIDSQIAAISGFSRMVQNVPEGHREGIQKQWNKICHELAKEPVTLSEKFSSRVNEIQRVLTNPPQVKNESQTAAVEVASLLCNSSVSIAIDLITDTHEKLHSPNWVRDLQKMLERAMQGVYGSSFRKKLQASPRVILNASISTFIFLDRVLRKQDYSTISSINWDRNVTKKIEAKISTLTGALRKKCGLSHENIREVLIKEIQRHSPAAKEPIITDGLWDLIRPYVDPSDKQLEAIACSLTEHHPKKAFQIACQIRENRIESLLKVFTKIACYHLDVAIDLIEQFHAMEKPLFSKCAGEIAKALLQNHAEFSEALPYIQEITDEETLVELAPQVAQKADLETLINFTHQAKSLGAKAQILELLISKLGIDKAEALIDTVKDPYLKDLCFSSLFLRHPHKIESFEKIQEKDVRLDTLERLVLEGKCNLAEVVKELKDESEQKYLIEQITYRKRKMTSEMLDRLSDQRKKDLLQLINPDSLGVIK